MTDFDDFGSDEVDDCCQICGDPLCPGCGSSVQNRLIKFALLPVGIVLIAFLFRTIFLGDGTEMPGESAQTTNAIRLSTTTDFVQTTTSSSTVATIEISPIPTERSSPDWGLLARSVVYIEASTPCDVRGSGTIVLDGSFVLTNHHVASNGECILRLGLTESLNTTPTRGYFGEVIIADAVLDLTVLRIVDRNGIPSKISGHNPVKIDYNQPPLGSQLATLGYPALGNYEAGMTITFTNGTFSGIDYTDGEFYKTDAQMRGGVSGGAAFNDKGLFIGVPTAGLIDESGQPVGINLIRPAKFARPLLESAERNGN